MRSGFMAEVDGWLRIHHQLSYMKQTEANMSMADELIQHFGWSVISERLIHPMEKANIRRGTKTENGSRGESLSEDQGLPCNDETLALVKLVSILDVEAHSAINLPLCKYINRWAHNNFVQAAYPGM